MDKLLSFLGKTGDNVGFAALLTLFGKKIPVEYLIFAHTAVVALKGYFIQTIRSPSRVEVVQKAFEVVEPLILRKDSTVAFTNEDRAMSAAQRINAEINSSKKMLSDARSAQIIQEEMSKSENDVYIGAMSKMTLCERKVIEERIIAGAISQQAEKPKPQLQQQA